MRKFFILISALLTFINIYLIFQWVPTEINQGAIQRILYLHVPLAWVSMLTIIIIAITSIIYLITKNIIWDHISVSLAEVGIVSAIGMLLSGIIWAKPVWGVWWTGEAKLTTALILFFIYCAYLMFRNYFPPGPLRERSAAVIAIIGAIDTPFIYYAAQIWEQNHPTIVIGPLATQESNLGGDLALTLLFSILTITLIFFLVVFQQTRFKILEFKFNQIKTKT
ncbi:MAG: cytochrome c biogenesis protein [Dehalococcoidia bacterium]|jgi:heme exporter protein C|nr:cytochrome c biogenesis protein [Dehalococcoidia bacterium]